MRPRGHRHRRRDHQGARRPRPPGVEGLRVQQGPALPSTSTATRDRLDHPLRRTGGRVGAGLAGPTRSPTSPTGCARSSTARARSGGRSTSATRTPSTASPVRPRRCSCCRSGRPASSAPPPRTAPTSSRSATSSTARRTSTRSPDLAHTDHLLCSGRTPGSRSRRSSRCPTRSPPCSGVVERGGTVTFVNPLRIEPDLGETVQVRPDTDPYLLAAMLHHIDRTVGFDARARTATTSTTSTRCAAWLRQYSPERVAPVVGVDADASSSGWPPDFAAAPTAAVHMSTGVEHGPPGRAGLLPRPDALAGHRQPRPTGRQRGPRPGPSGPMPADGRAGRRVAGGHAVGSGAPLEGQPPGRAPPRLDPRPRRRRSGR